MSIILKTLAIVFSLGLIVSYSVYKHKQGSTQLNPDPSDPPLGPGDPAMFSTSKSGPIDVIPVQPKIQFSTSKSMAPILNSNDLSQATDQFIIPPDSSDPESLQYKIESLNSNEFLIPTTKSGVVFRPNDIQLPNPPPPVQQSQTNLQRQSNQER